MGQEWQTPAQREWQARYHRERAQRERERAQRERERAQRERERAQRERELARAMRMWEWCGRKTCRRLGDCLGPKAGDCVTRLIRSLGEEERAYVSLLIKGCRSGASVEEAQRSARAHISGVLSEAGEALPAFLTDEGADPSS